MKKPGLGVGSCGVETTLNEVRTNRGMGGCTGLIYRALLAVLYLYIDPLDEVNMKPCGNKTSPI